LKQQQVAESTEEICPKCGKQFPLCICNAFQAAAAWPNLGKKSDLDVDMTARFLRLKETGTGTLFVSASAEPHPFSGISIDLAPEAIIGGVYQIISLVGRGGMGEVYLATHLTLDKKCALKVIPPNEVTEVGWQRFQLEAKIVSRLEHVNLVRVTDLGIHEECLPFYAMEYIEGQNLAEVLAAQGPMPLIKALEIFMQVCDGVECAHHSGVLHRDLKPANIMLTETAAGKLEVKILDFGLAKLTKHDRFKQSLTGSGDVFGSPCYMSPEQCGDAELDNRSDIYSMGCTLFECLTGGPPFSGNLAAAVFFGHLEAPPPTLEKVTGQKFPDLMEDVIAKLLCKNPNDRYQTMSEVKADLERVAYGHEGPWRSELGGTAVTEMGSARGSFGPLILGRSALRLWLPISFAAVIGLGCSYYYEVASHPPINVAISPELRRSPGKTTSLMTAAKIGSATTASATAVNLDTSPAQSKQEPYDKDGDWDGLPFYKGIVLKDGKQSQHWRYLGHRAPPLYFIYPGSGGVNEVGLAGDVYIPASAKICAMPKQALVHSPSLVNGLKGAVFDEVDYEWYSLPDVQAANAAFAGCKSIKAVRMGNTYWSKEDGRASVAAINQFPNLERLILSTYVDGHSLAKISRLSALTELRLNSGQIRLHDCLTKICGSKNLTCLAALSWGIPSSDLALLLKSPHLQRLMIGQLTGSHRQLAILARLPMLQRLELPALHFRPDLSSDLKLLKSLKTLRFFVSSEWSDDQLVQLKGDLPHVNVVTYANVKDLREAFWLP
jgi:serine/threonine protein kinase